MRRAPHPRGVRCGIETVRLMAETAERMGAPKGLIQCLEDVTIQGTGELMRHRRTSVVMATGGPGMVRAAYSSGKPTLAVGAGNVPCFVHASKRDDVAEVAEMIVTSKSFDYGTACVSEQAVIADRTLARDLRHELRLKGAYFLTPAEADRLAAVIFTGRQAMNPENVGQSPQALAAKAGFDVPPRTRCLISEETEIGWQRPLSAEKLNPVLAFYEARDEAEGLRLSRGIAEFEGWGHSAVIHSDDPAAVAAYSALPVGRVLVNTPAIMGGMGYSTDLEPSFMLGTGTWSGSITSDNVTALHLINIKRVAWQNRPWRDIYEEYGA
ncbi:MAG: aldehyde dehydrogenase family protein [Pseudomonadota bacterium]